MGGIILIIFLVIIFIYYIVKPSKDEEEERYNISGQGIFKSICFKKKFLTEDEKLFLNKNIRFYQFLDQSRKIEFEKRLVKFINIKKFEAREDYVISIDTVLLISAAAIIVSFGLQNYKYEDFEKIIIYPDIYYSKFTHTQNKGETNPHGVIVISSKYADEGFKDENDCINLCYHEFAHALVLMNMNNTLDDEDFSFFFNYFSHKIRYDHLSQYVREKGILRDYAFTNKMEFFAVCVEYFFEDPKKLRDVSNDLYCLIACMLNQDFIGQRIVDNFKSNAYKSYDDRDDVYF